MRFFKFANSRSEIGISNEKKKLLKTCFTIVNTFGYVFIWATRHPWRRIKFFHSLRRHPNFMTALANPSWTWESREWGKKSIKLWKYLLRGCCSSSKSVKSLLWLEINVIRVNWMKNNANRNEKLWKPRLEDKNSKLRNSKNVLRLRGDSFSLLAFVFHLFTVSFFICQATPKISEQESVREELKIIRNVSINH